MNCGLSTISHVKVFLEYLWWTAVDISALLGDVIFKCYKICWQFKIDILVSILSDDSISYCVSNLNLDSIVAVFHVGCFLHCYFILVGLSLSQLLLSEYCCLVWSFWC